MNRKHTLPHAVCALLLGTGALFAAQATDLSGFKPVNVAQDKESIQTLEFEKNSIPKFYLPKDFSFDPAGGESGTGALYYNKTDPEAYRLAAYPLPLKPEYRYRVTVKYKAEDIRNAPKSTSRLFCIEFTKKGKYAGGVYFYKPIVENQWTEIALEFQPPADFDRAIAHFYLTKHATGKVWWDNMHIEPIGVLPALIYDRKPSNLTIRDRRGEFAVRSRIFLSNRIPDADTAVHLTLEDGRTFLWRGKNQLYAGELGNLPDGPVAIKAKLLDMKHKTILAEKTIRIRVKKDAPGKYASRIDDHGRVLVGGKPFLPIGFYCSKIDESMLKNLKAGGFNCAMPYRGGDGALTDRFDLAQKYGIKLLMNVMYQRPRGKGMQQAIPVMEFEGVKGVEPVLQAWARKLKNHPALLGYYLSDENPIREIPYMRHVRELLSESDPDHLTVTLTYIPRHFPFFAETGDVLAVDTYPVETDASRSMESVSDLVRAAGETGLAVWLVPQAFNWANYKGGTPEQLRKYRFPTETEMRSMFLAGAVNGAKGFLLYNYSDIFGPRAEKATPGKSAEHWTKVVAAAKVLKKIEPFLLSTESAPDIRTEKSVRTQLRAWRANGKCAVAVAGIGPGVCTAEFSVPAGIRLKSCYGGTENLGNGKYRFTGKDISSDLLIGE